MQHISFNELVHVVPVVVAPVILISGVGLLLLTMTNRMGRAIDRARALTREGKRAGEQDRVRIKKQVAILYQRARLLRVSILLAALSVVFAGLLVVTLFVQLLCTIGTAPPAAVLFIGSIASLLASLAAFIRDINIATDALRIELEQGDHADTA